jgi:formylglycine-generating enzyme required for sulfatase activity
VRIGRFAVGKTHVTVDQFKAFVEDARYAASTACYKWPFARQNGSWRDPGFTQEGSHPVICVSFDDAQAYAGWMSRKTGKRPYRLLTEAEFEYTARGQMQPGAYPRFWYGNELQERCRFANGTGQCDGFEYTSPAGHFPPSAFGLYDMAGNAWQWTADCYHGNYSGAPSNGSAWTSGGCSGGRVIRGGSWDGGPRYLRAAARRGYTGTDIGIGFRLARTLTP